MTVLIKIHKVYREIIAVCDSELVGKKLENDKMQLEVSKEFYGGEEMSENRILKLLKEKVQEDASFNFVGNDSIEIGIKAGIIDKERIIKIKNVPHAMALL